MKQAAQNRYSRHCHSLYYVNSCHKHNLLLVFGIDKRSVIDVMHILHIFIPSNFKTLHLFMSRQGFWGKGPLDVEQVRDARHKRSINNTLRGYGDGNGVCSNYGLSPLHAGTAFRVTGSLNYVTSFQRHNLEPSNHVEHKKRDSFKPCRKVVFGAKQTLKRNEPHLEKGHEKLSTKNDVFFCVPLCLRSLMPVEDVMYFIYLK